jgi:hypothetical protein
VSLLQNVSALGILSQTAEVPLQFRQGRAHFLLEASKHLLIGFLRHRAAPGKLTFS